MGLRARATVWQARAGTSNSASIARMDEVRLMVIS
jgi:hypothetical protein